MLGDESLAANKNLSNISFKSHCIWRLNLWSLNTESSIQQCFSLFSQYEQMTSLHCQHFPVVKK